MANKRIFLDLIDQMIERATQEDEELKKRLIEEKKLCQTIGESWMVFHLQTLKSLVSDDDEWYTL